MVAAQCSTRIVRPTLDVDVWRSTAATGAARVNARRRRRQHHCGPTPQAMFLVGGGYNLILQQSWEVVRDLDAAGGYEGGAVIVGFREIWVA